MCSTTRHHACRPPFHFPPLLLPFGFLACHFGDHLLMSSALLLAAEKRSTPCNSSVRFPPLFPVSPKLRPLAARRARIPAAKHSADLPPSSRVSSLPTPPIGWHSDPKTRTLYCTCVCARGLTG